MSTLMKKHIFLEGSRPFGAFLLNEDSQGRPYFKFSLRPKIYEGDLWIEDRATGRIKSTLPQKAVELSCSASYKFADHLLSFKVEEPGQCPRYRMTEVPTPPERHLFSVRIRNWEHIETAEMEQGDLMLAPPWPCREIAIFFSFAGKNGKPFMPEDEFMVMKEGSTITLDIPLPTPYNKLWIGVGEAMPNDNLPDLTLRAPNMREFG